MGVSNKRLCPGINETTIFRAAHSCKEYTLANLSVTLCAAHKTGTEASYLHRLQNRLVEIWKARVVIHHAVHQLRHLHQEGCAGGQAVTSEGVNQVNYMRDNLKRNRDMHYGHKG